MNCINLDLFRAALRGKPDRKIHYYVMPHAPGTTNKQWRRQFYAALAHGIKVVNLFRLEPLPCAETENYVADIARYPAIRQALWELGSFEDIVQSGQVCESEVALWFSRTGDIWHDRRDPFSAAKRALYIAIRQQQAPVDFVDEEDAARGVLDRYAALYLTDAHVSEAASESIAARVRRGGHLFATAGAGMYDQYNRPNRVLNQLLAIDRAELETPEVGRVRFIKQDLPFCQPLETVEWATSGDVRKLAVYSAINRFTVSGADTVATFRDGSPAVSRRLHGHGVAMYCGFLYFKPAIPKRPVDRGSHDESMTHLIPTQFDSVAAELIGLPLNQINLPLHCSEPLVETTVIQSGHGTVIPMINWSGGSVKNLKVTIHIPVPHGHAARATGDDLQFRREGHETIYELDLNVADALILR